MSLEAHHRFILDTMQRNQDIARNIINDLEAENARLKAEVERLTEIVQTAHADLFSENARLKAEVETLKEAWVDKKMQEDRDALLLEVERLRASSFVTAVPVEQYERLVKAGDELLDGWIGMYGDHKGSMAENYIELWNAAKEGKPSV